MADGFDDARLLVVTSRLPFVFQRTDDRIVKRAGAGGLTSAVDTVLQKRGGTWVGWPGVSLRRGESLDLRGAPYRIRPVALSDRELTRYYHGFSNRTLWPLCHSLPSRARFDAKDWPVYRRVNRRFAKVALLEHQEDSLIWVHDYHLMLTPHYLRRYLSRARIALFLHVPFPPFDIFRIAPWARELLRGLCTCDLMGFQTESYVRNFLDSAQQLLGADVDPERGRVRIGDHVTRVGAFPIGIDFEAFDARARASSAAVNDVRIVLAADRLDYTKGIPERIRAMEQLLDRHPEHRERVTLIQVAVPSRSQVAEYRTLKREIDEQVGRVNGRFSTARWSPIQYLYQSLEPARLAQLYRNADVALVTPLRDGMNLVAKEYVACQTEDRGVLLLSRLAGAAETMKEAVLVNPYDVDQTAERLHRALSMADEERRERMRALRRRERESDVHFWASSFLSAAASNPADRG